jgi:hypothetical protein
MEVPSMDIVLTKGQKFIISEKIRPHIDQSYYDLIGAEIKIDSTYKYRNDGNDKYKTINFRVTDNKNQFYKRSLGVEFMYFNCLIPVYNSNREAVIYLKKD